MCGYQSGQQENWLITQFINVTGVQKRNEYMYVVIEIRKIVNSECTAAVNCYRSVEMYVLQTDENSQSIVQNVSNFNNKVEIASGNIDFIKIQLLPSTSGLYVAFKDIGTCMNLTRLRVYVTVCDAVYLQLGAKFLNTAYPGETSIGSCLPNMATKSDLNAPNGTFNGTCILELFRTTASWRFNGNLQCMCHSGYHFTSHLTENQCQGRLYSC